MLERNAGKGVRHVGNEPSRLAINRIENVPFRLIRHESSGSPTQLSGCSRNDPARRNPRRPSEAARPRPGKADR